MNSANLKYKQMNKKKPEATCLHLRSKRVAVLESTDSETQISAPIMR